MSNLLLILSVLTAAYFFYKYRRQTRAIRMLTESLEDRSSILASTDEFGAEGKSWGGLIRELNRLIEEAARLGKESGDRLRQIQTTLESLREGVLIIDQSNYILLVNKALKTKFPAVNESVGQRLESAVSSVAFLEFVAEVKREGGGAGREVAFARGTTELWMEVSASRLQGFENEGNDCYLFVLHDITRLKELEQMRRQFVANASHELKTPVSVIKGYAETLVEHHQSMDAADRDRFLQTINRHSDRLTLLINDLLSLSRLEDKSIPLEEEARDLFAWLRGLATEYCQSLAEEGRAIELELPEGVEAEARFDSLKLRQVMDNLVENAKKYTPSDATIRLGGAIGEAGAEIWVADGGPGVPETDLGRIFERFYRVDKGRSRDSGGTGLGLSIVKHIVALHHGQVWAENLEGGGLKVALRLPLVRKESSQPLL